MKPVRHKGYIARLKIDPEEDIIYGRAIGLRDIITFEGRTVAEAKQAFRDSVDEYLAFCEERGRSPERPRSGNFQVRVDPDLHRRLAILAEAKGLTLSEFVRRKLGRAAREDAPSARSREPIAAKAPKPADRKGEDVASSTAEIKFRGRRRGKDTGIGGANRKVPVHKPEKKSGSPVDA